MKEEKLVSVILPVYNGEKYIASSIESIINQTYQNWELIIVNDCSTDNTLGVIEKYTKNEPRIRVVNNLINKKLPATLNVGFAEATGVFLTWTSDDNIFRPEAFAKMVQELSADTTLAMVYADYTDIDKDGNVLNEVKLEKPDEIIRGNVIGACFMYTRAVAKEVGNYDVNLFLAEDYDYWLRIYVCGRMKHLNEDLYYYRRHAGALTETKKELINMQTYKTLEKNFVPLYVGAKVRGKQYELFNQMINRVFPDMKEDVKEMLFAIDAGYRFYLLKRSLGSKVKKIFFKRK